MTFPSCKSVLHCFMLNYMTEKNSLSYSCCHKTNALYYRGHARLPSSQHPLKRLIQPLKWEYNILLCIMWSFFPFISSLLSHISCFSPFRSASNPFVYRSCSWETYGIVPLQLYKKVLQQSYLEIDTLLT